MNKMLALQKCPQFVSRIFTDASGRQYCLTFFITEIDGQLRGRLISVEPVSKVISTEFRLAGNANQSNQYCLAAFCHNELPAVSKTTNCSHIASPYFSLDFLINSQPTRAPSNK